MSESLPGPEPETVVTPFESPSEYADAWRALLALAVTDVLVFDRDLKDGNWNAAERHDTLRRFLLGNRRARLQIVVHDTTFIEGRLPRVVGLLRDFSHRMEIRRTIEDGRNAWDAFALVDDRHVLHRFHQSFVRGELSLHAPNKARELKGRLDEILLFTEPGVNATQLGL